MKRYSEEHEWVELQNGIATVGITAYAAEELGDITFVELPEKGKAFAPGAAMCVVESVKAASDVFIPVGGTIAEVNSRLEDTPELINASPEKDGWICKLTQVNEKELDRLMTEEQYKAFTAKDDKA